MLVGVLRTLNLWVLLEVHQCLDLEALLEVISSNGTRARTSVLSVRATSPSKTKFNRTNELQCFQG